MHGIWCVLHGVDDVVGVGKTVETSLCVLFEKEGRGLLREVRGSALLAGREGVNKKGWVLENAGEHWRT